MYIWCQSWLCVQAQARFYYLCTCLFKSPPPPPPPSPPSTPPPPMPTTKPKDHQWPFFTSTTECCRVSTTKLLIFVFSQTFSLKVIFVFAKTSNLDYVYRESPNFTKFMRKYFCPDSTPWRISGGLVGWFGF